MRASTRLVALMTVMATLLAGRSMAANAQQQAETPLAITRSNHDSAGAADPGSTITAVYLIENRAHTALKLVPQIAVPPDWSVVTGRQAFSLAPGESDTWVIAISVPTQAPAGRHIIPVALGDSAEGRTLVRDSVIVAVRERRAIEVIAMDHPSWVIAGKAYAASFLVRNAGNGASPIRLEAHDAHGTRVDLDAGSMTLGADSSAMVHALVATRAEDGLAGADVLELAATNVADTSASASTSVRVMVVPPPGATEQFATVPAQLSLRAAGPGTGIAPAELVGGGRLNDKSPDQVDFVLRGPTAQQSVFGDRDEYRIGITAPTYQARVGDAFYGFSQLTQAGQEGFGGGGEASLGVVTAGAYGEGFRYVPRGGSDAGASIAFRPAGLFSASQLGLQVVDRVGGELPGKVVSSRLVMNPVPGAHLDAEYALSHSASGPGSATELLLSGNNFFQYDLSHIAGTAAFAGPPQASLHDYANVATPAWHDLQLNFSGSSHASDAAESQYHLHTMNVGVSTVSGTSLAFVVASKRQSVASIADTVIGAGSFGLTPSMPGSVGLDPALGGSSEAADDGLQRGLVGRFQQTFGVNQAWVQSELGSTRLAATGTVKAYQDLEVGNTVDVGANTVGVFAQIYRGVSVTRGPTPQTILGGNANIQLSHSTTLFFVGSGSIGHAGSNGYTQVDARLTHSLNTGASISLRARILASSFVPTAARRLVFLEYSLPIKLPVGEAQTPGRVRGRIVNSETGQGVAGALVRLGGQTAVTDANGRVWFNGLAPGQYRVSLSQDMAFAGTAVDGDPSVLVETKGQPATFQLAVARAASVEGTVHHWVVARTSVSGEPDSLVDAGPMRGVVVALSSGRDTLYRTTDESGRFRFTELPPKRWMVRVVSPPPAHARFEPDEMQLDLLPGKSSETSFRLVPVHREVHMLQQSDDPVPISAPASAPISFRMSSPVATRLPAPVSRTAENDRRVSPVSPKSFRIPPVRVEVRAHASVRRNRAVTRAATLNRPKPRHLARTVASRTNTTIQAPGTLGASGADDTHVASGAFKRDGTLVVEWSAPFQHMPWRRMPHLPILSGTE